MRMTISQLKESIGIYLLFVLALTSSFLGIYITVYDLFKRNRNGFPDNDDFILNFYRNKMKPHTFDPFEDTFENILFFSINPHSQ